MMSASLLSGLRPMTVPRYAWDFADGLRNYKGPLNTGRWNAATIRLVGYLISLPDATHKIWACHEGAALYGWRGATGGVSGGLSMWFGGSGGYVETARHVFVAGDVGKMFVMHATCQNGVGARLFVAGAEVGTITGAVTMSDPGGAGRLVIGQYIGGGFVNPHVGIIALSLSGTVMTPTEIATDAARIMARTRGIALPLIPGEDQRHVAIDVESTSDWHDRIGSLTLTETGDVAVSRVP